MAIPPAQPARPPRYRPRRRTPRLGFYAVLLLAGLVGIVYYLFTLSLPQLDGVVVVAPEAKLEQPVGVQRDSRGVPRIVAQTAGDAYFALGFLHAQDRFFQMDLMRRRAAGELSGLVGRAALATDIVTRIHRFRHRADAILGAMNEQQREVLAAYVAGVNEGLARLMVVPPEYVLLTVNPEPWAAADCLLVQWAMFLTLQAEDFEREYCLGVAKQTLPPAAYAVLTADGDEWDAPLIGEPISPPPLPTAAEYDLRSYLAEHPPAADAELGSALSVDPLPIGSNSWAVAGSRTADGRAILANDMHLGLSVPNTWYQASVEYTNAAGETVRAVGATLPGAPAVVVGSNERIAWGFTNTEGDWSDLIILEALPDQPGYYLGTNGPTAIKQVTELIPIRGEDSYELVVEETEWGPVWDKTDAGQRLVLRWVAHDTQGVNLRLAELAETRTLEQALTLAADCGSPHQNLLLADDTGHIAWTVLGQIPRRSGDFGRTPTSSNRWADGELAWQGYLTAEQQPKVVDPADGILWTANNRLVDGEAFAAIGNGGFNRGARAQVIRNHLREMQQPTEFDLFNLQLATDGLFLERWRLLMIGLVYEQLRLAGAPEQPEHQFWDQVREVLEAGPVAAEATSVGYRLVYEFRQIVAKQLLDAFTAPCKAAYPEFSYARLTAAESVVWQMIKQKPEHLLPPPFATWDKLLANALRDWARDPWREDRSLATYTWGKSRHIVVRHPLTLALPPLGGLLNMRTPTLGGAPGDVPRIQNDQHGASQRMVVSPGHEDQAIFHMPGGSAGHPFSTYYAEGHWRWAHGVPSPLLPGPARHTLYLRPAITPATNPQ